MKLLFGRRALKAQRRGFTVLLAFMMFCATGYTAVFMGQDTKSGTIGEVTSDTTIKEVPQSGSPMELSAEENFAISYGLLVKAGAFTSSKKGVVKASVGFIPYDQTVESERVVTRMEVFQEILSLSSLKKVAEQKYVALKSQRSMIRKPSKFSGDTPSWANSASELSMKAFSDRYGSLGNTLTPYIVNGESIIDAKIIESEGDGLTTMTLKLRPDKSAQRYLRELITMSGSSTIPLMSRVELTLSVDNNWRPVRLTTVEAYSMTLPVIGAINCTGTIVEEFHDIGKEVVFSDASFYRNYIPLGSDPIEGGGDDGFVEAKSATDYLMTAFGGIITTGELNYDFRAILGENELKGNLKGNINKLNFAVRLGGDGEIYYNNKEIYIGYGNIRMKANSKSLNKLSEIMKLFDSQGKLPAIDKVDFGAITAMLDIGAIMDNASLRIDGEKAYVTLGDIVLEGLTLKVEICAKEKTGELIEVFANIILGEKEVAQFALTPSAFSGSVNVANPEKYIDVENILDFVKPIYNTLKSSDLTLDIAVKTNNSALRSISGVVALDNIGKDMNFLGKLVIDNGVKHHLDLGYIDGGAQVKYNKFALQLDKGELDSIISLIKAKLSGADIPSLPQFPEGSEISQAEIIEKVMDKLSKVDFVNVVSEFYADGNNFILALDGASLGYKGTYRLELSRDEQYLTSIKLITDNFSATLAINTSEIDLSGTVLSEKANTFGVEIAVLGREYNGEIAFDLSEKKIALWLNEGISVILERKDIYLAVGEMRIVANIDTLATDIKRLVGDKKIDLPTAEIANIVANLDLDKLLESLTIVSGGDKNSITTQLNIAGCDITLAVTATDNDLNIDIFAVSGSEKISLNLNGESRYTGDYTFERAKYVAMNDLLSFVDPILNTLKLSQFALNFDLAVNVGGKSIKADGVVEVKLAGEKLPDLHISLALGLPNPMTIDLILSGGILYIDYNGVKITSSYEYLLTSADWITNLIGIEVPYLDRLKTGNMTQIMSVISEILRSSGAVKPSIPDVDLHGVDITAFVSRLEYALGTLTLEAKADMLGLSDIYLNITKNDKIISALDLSATLEKIAVDCKLRISDKTNIAKPINLGEYLNIDSALNEIVSAKAYSGSFDTTVRLTQFDANGLPILDELGRPQYVRFNAKASADITNIDGVIEGNFVIDVTGETNHHVVATIDDGVIYCEYYGENPAKAKKMKMTFTSIADTFQLLEARFGFKVELIDKLIAMGKFDLSLETIESLGLLKDLPQLGEIIKGGTGADITSVITELSQAVEGEENVVTIGLDMSKLGKSGITTIKLAHNGGSIKGVQAINAPTAVNEYSDFDIRLACDTAFPPIAPPAEPNSYIDFSSANIFVDRLLNTFQGVIMDASALNPKAKNSVEISGKIKLNIIGIPALDSWRPIVNIKLNNVGGNFRAEIYLEMPKILAVTTRKTQSTLYYENGFIYRHLVIGKQWAWEKVKIIKEKIPMDKFMGNFVPYLMEMLNFTDSIAKQIVVSDPSTPKITPLFEDVLDNYSYANGIFNLDLNGAALAGDSMVGALKPDLVSDDNYLTKIGGELVFVGGVIKILPDLAITVKDDIVINRPNESEYVAI